MVRYLRRAAVDDWRQEEALLILLGLMGGGGHRIRGLIVLLGSKMIRNLITIHVLLYPLLRLPFLFGSSLPNVAKYHGRELAEYRYRIEEKHIYQVENDLIILEKFRHRRAGPDRQDEIVSAPEGQWNGEADRCQAE